MVRFPQTVSRDSGQFFSSFQGFINFGFVGSREVHSNRDAFIQALQIYALSLDLPRSNINNICIFISFNAVYVIPVYAVLFIFMMPVGDMSMLDYAMKVAGDKIFAFKTYFNEVF